MLVIRPIQKGDLNALYNIAVESGIGFTSLPVNQALLEQKIESSLLAFKHNAMSTRGHQSYLFVLENTENKEIIGTAGIEASVGLHDAFYHYHLGKVVHASRELGVHNTVDTLTFCNDYTGASEICSLFLRENARSGLNGKMLSKFRFLFMAEHRERFSDVVIAEMRGVNDENGKSPFWEWLEEHFFSVDFPTADYLTGIGNKVFIAELMPKYPIYVNLLSKEAQKCIGKVHEKTKPALKLLEQEGFKYRGYVDIFDAGPTVEADLSNIATVRNSKLAKVKIVDQLTANAPSQLLINTKIGDFRACISSIAIKNTEEILIDPATATNLLVKTGEQVRFSQLAKQPRSAMNA